mmetsp:Transcript_44427/g.141448  ORF Transcript_44427/g.141448 Transcript_44427/m.141448 type:complete len:221 (+) Transcript_44427:511-1173(+)
MGTPDSHTDGHEVVLRETQAAEPEPDWCPNCPEGGCECIHDEAAYHGGNPVVPELCEHGGRQGGRGAKARRPLDEVRERPGHKHHLRHWVPAAERLHLVNDPGETLGVVHGLEQEDGPKHDAHGRYGIKDPCQDCRIGKVGLCLEVDRPHHPQEGSAQGQGGVGLEPVWPQRLHEQEEDGEEAEEHVPAAAPGATFARHAPRYGQMLAARRDAEVKRVVF